MCLLPLLFIACRGNEEHCIEDLKGHWLDWNVEVLEISAPDYEVEEVRAGHALRGQDIFLQVGSDRIEFDRLGLASFELKAEGSLDWPQDAEYFGNVGGAGGAGGATGVHGISWSEEPPVRFNVKGGPDLTVILGCELEPAEVSVNILERTIVGETHIFEDDRGVDVGRVDSDYLRDFQIELTLLPPPEPTPRCPELPPALTVVMRMRAEFDDVREEDFSTCH